MAKSAEVLGPMLQHIERTGFARTPVLATTFKVSPARVTKLLAPLVERQILVACAVISKGQEMHEYRAMGGKIGHSVNFRDYVIGPPADRRRYL